MRWKWRRINRPSRWPDASRARRRKRSPHEVARSVPGIKAVVNKLVVEKELALALTKKQDESITVLIKERFAKSSTLKAANFEVKTEEGIVSTQRSRAFPGHCP